MEQYCKNKFVVPGINVYPSLQDSGVAKQVERGDLMPAWSCPLEGVHADHIGTQLADLELA